MIHLHGLTAPEAIRWPRTSGDDPAHAYEDDVETLLAPHERG